MTMPPSREMNTMKFVNLEQQKINLHPKPFSVSDFLYRTLAVSRASWNAKRPRDSMSRNTFHSHSNPQSTHQVFVFPNKSHVKPLKLKRYLNTEGGSRAYHCFLRWKCKQFSALRKLAQWFGLSRSHKSVIQIVHLVGPPSDGYSATLP